MKALTATQPIATLLTLQATHAHLAKRLDAHNWSTDYRGPIAIHASRTFPTWAIKLCFQEPFSSILHAAGYKTIEDIPIGAILSVGSLHDVIPSEVVRAQLARYGPNEHLLGNFITKKFAFDIRVTVALPKPLEARGDRGLWDLPAATASHLLGLYHEHERLERRRRQREERA